MVEDGKKRLGKGLAALLGDIAEETIISTPSKDGIKKVPIANITANPRNPRLEFNANDLHELAASIKAKGVLSPILVRVHPLVPGTYELIAGERRWRAAQLAGLTDIPVLLQDVTDQESLEIALIENIQRSDLNVIDEALGYQHLMKDFGYKHEQIAAVVSKSRSHITNILRMLKLPDSIQSHVRSGALSAGHAKILVGLDNADEVAKAIIEQGWSVRDLENALQAETAAEAAPKQRDNYTAIASKIPELKELERLMSEHLGLNVKVIEKRGGVGSHIKIYYDNNEQFGHLENILKRR